MAVCIEGKKAELRERDDKVHPPLIVDHAWHAYCHAVNRPDCGDETLRHYGHSFRKFARWLKNHHREVRLLRDVTRAVAEDYAAFMLEERLSPRTFNKHVMFLSLLFRTLWDQAKMESRPNPWDRIRRRRGVTNSRRELNSEELGAVCSVATGEMRFLFALGIYTGMRMGDCACLRWNEVDLARRFIRRVPNKTSRRKAAPVTIPLHQVLFNMLQEAVNDRRSQYVLPEMQELYGRDKHWLSRKIQKLFKGAGIQTHKPGTGPGTGKRAVVEVGFHSLRHTFVSLCREAGAPLAVVEALVGHSSPAMTRHYTHISEHAAMRAVALLPVLPALGTASPSPTPPDDQGVTVPAARVRELAEALTPGNAEETRHELLMLLT